MPAVRGRNGAEQGGGGMGVRSDLEEFYFIYLSIYLFIYYLFI